MFDTDLIWWVLPVLLSAVLLSMCIAAASIRISRFIAKRYLINFRLTILSTITIFAIMGTTLAVAALTVVTGISTGFQAEFQRKVLGVNAHVLVLKYLDFPEYRRVMEQVSEIPGVAGVNPFIIHPMMVVFGLYIAGLLMNAMLAISVVGHEGKALWILKSLPLRSRDVMHGKALSLVVTGIPAMAVVAVPYMVVSLLPWYVNVVLFALFLIIPLTFTGIGIAGGALFGSYGDDKGRSIAAQFIVMSVCMIMLIVVAGLPVTTVIEYGPRAGFITTLIMLAISYNIYRIGILLAAKGFNKVDAEDYM